MKIALRLMALTVVLFVTTAHPVVAQTWFSGLGFSAGGGPLRFGGGRDDPITSLVRPEEDTVGVAAFGLFLGLGNRRWAVMLPEIQWVPALIETGDVPGALTLGSTTVPFVTNSHSMNSAALLVAGQVALVPNGRAWVRGGIGGGWVSRHIDTVGEKISVDLSSDDGLALSGTVGVSVWTKSLSGHYSMSVDAEVHYLSIRSDVLRVSVPSFRVGWSVMPSGR